MMLSHTKEPKSRRRWLMGSLVNTVAYVCAGIYARVIVLYSTCRITTMLS